MKLNADLSRCVVLHTEDLPCLASPMADVELRMLDQEGEEVARATSIVRYAVNSCFLPMFMRGSRIFGYGKDFFRNFLTDKGLIR